ncbi:MAG: bifunctional DNA-formamidopyrimidine glycosylase/DNA-(apurinic or apyrimidinic site) lyase [Nitrospira sp.]|nr:MAG: bifunctional DNA-formamidopyrimidine glycosylase/DNA-(apurinic or apyrimidinic site) lyase [Nitrospira sp.]
MIRDWCERTTRISHMPELPEAEVVTQQLRTHLIGAQLNDCWVGRADIVREGLSTLPWYRGARLDMVERYGKSVALGFHKDGELRYAVAELGMTGLLLFRTTETKHPQHVHVRMSFAGGRESELRYWNPRRFGRLSLLDRPGLDRYRARRFGVDPVTVPRDEFVRLMRARRGRLKPLLMHQQVIAGIGNIYANEILFRTKLHPNREVSRLREAAIISLYDTMQTVLRDAISCGGSSVKDFFAPDGTEGHYKQHHLVYGKEGQRCPNHCGRVIRRLQSERSSFVCPACQRNFKV